MNIASHIINKVGGHKRVSEICGCTLSWVHKWTYPKERGGRDGHIPDDCREKLWAAAQRGEIDLVAEDFFPRSDTTER